MSRQGALAGATFFVATESTFGSVLTTDVREIDLLGLTGLTWYPLQTLRADIGGFTGALKMPVYQPETTTARGGMAPPEVEAVVDSSGAITKRLRGEFTLTLPMRWLGNTVPGSSAMGVLLGSALTFFGHSAGTTDAVLTTPSANTLTVADAGIYTPGEIVAINTNGKFYYHRVTAISAVSDLLTLETEHGLTDEGTLYRCQHWLPSDDGTTTNQSFAIFMSDRAQTHQVLAVGCRVMGITINRVGNDGASLELVLRCMASDGSYIENASFAIEDFTGPLPWGITGTRACKVLNAPVVMTENHSADAAPWSGTSVEIPCRTWSANISLSMDPRGGGQANRSGANDYDLTEGNVTVTLTMDPPAVLSGVPSPRDILKDSEARSLTVTLGGAATSGSGGCLHIARADVGDDPGLTVDDERKSYSVTFRNGQYEGDTPIGTHLRSNAPWCLAFVS